jgi:hypothetical protein
MTGIPPPARPRATSVALSAHFPDRPSWRCEICAEPWPCPTRRAEFTAATDAGAGQGVALALAAALGRAWLDQPDIQSDRLQAQFLGWISDDLYRRMTGTPRVTSRQ